MLVGERQSATLAGRVSESVVVLVFLTPWFLIGAGSTLVGLLALNPRRGDLAELWICLPAGITILLLVGVALYVFFWRMPRLTISHFELDGSRLMRVTRRDGAVSHAASELRSVVEERGRFGRGLWGWWLKFGSRPWVYLSRYTTNAEELVRQIGHEGGYQQPTQSLPATVVAVQSQDDGPGRPA